MTTHRSRRVADVVREILARHLLLDVRDPRIGFVTLTEVSLTPDLKHARVFVSVSALGEPEARKDAIEALNHAAPFFRRALAREAGLRHAPDLRFVEDEAAERGMRVEAALREIHRDDASGERPEEGEEPEDES